MNKPHTVKCLDATYDEDEEILVLNCMFEEGEGQRIVVMHRDDFHYKYYTNKVPHAEMHRTSEMFKGKKFNLIVENDPELENMSEEQKIYYASMFNKEMGEILDKVTEGLQEDSRIIARKKEEMTKIVRGRL